MESNEQPSRPKRACTPSFNTKPKTRTVPNTPKKQQDSTKARTLQFKDTTTRTGRINEKNNRQFVLQLKNKFEELSSNDDDGNSNESYESIVNPDDVDHPSLLAKKTPKKPMHDDKAPADGTKPIIIENYGETTQKLAERVKCVCTKPFTLKYLGKKVSVKTTSIEDHKNLISFLQQSNIQFHTFTLPELKDLSTVLKGLPPDYTNEEIEQEIKEQNDQVKNVIKMTTKNMTIYPIYLVKFHNSVNYREILNISYLFHTRIYWEKYRHNTTTQCYNCQLFGHGARNCNRQAKCLKCGQDHDSRNCTKPREEEPTCANCGENHLANSKHCTSYQNYLSKRKKKKPPLPQPKYNQQNQSFDIDEFPILPNSSDSTPKTQRSSWNRRNKTNDYKETHKIKESLEDINELARLLKELNELCNIKEMIQKIKSLNQNIKNAKSETEKLFMLMQLDTNLDE